MAHFPIPASPAVRVRQVDTFLGVDLTNDPRQVDPRRSPHAPNMIRDVPGKVRKCMGYERMAELGAPIRGAYCLRLESEHWLLHAGTRLYDADTGAVRFEGMADAPGSAWQLGGYLYIQDGARLLRFDGQEVLPAADCAYVPILTIGKRPDGGGQSYEPLNLIGAAFTELFGGTDTAADYQLSLAPLDEPGADGAPTVQAWSMDAEGVWRALSGFSVDYQNGVVSFAQPPGASPLPGEDNVKITARRTVPGYADRIGLCRCGALFGVGGLPDRLFVGGHPEHINRDWHSGQGDGTYWPDTAYSEVGGAASAIMGYAILNGRLACYKDGAEPARSVVLRSGELEEDEAVFPVYATLEGPGAVSRRTAGSLENEPLCLTRLGVYALTTSDVTGERYSQNRSFYLDGALLAEPQPQTAHACVFHDMYWLCINGKAYILDGLQSTVTDRAKPYSTRQYAGFLRLNLPAACMWVRDGRLWFGSEAGVVYRFFDDPDALASYADDGAAIPAVWQTPDLSGESFHRGKSVRYLAVRLASAVATGARVRAMTHGLWRQVLDDPATARYLSFGQVVFSKFTFSTDATTRTLKTHLALRRLDKVRFEFENSALQEPFGLMDIAVEYTEQGRVRR